MKSPRTVVVMAQNGLGDVIMALPMLASVDRALAQDTKLVFVIRSPVEERLIRLVKWRRPIELIQTGSERSWKAVRHLFGIAWRLRRLRPDIFLGAHMAARPRSSLFALVVGARVSIGEEGPWRKLGFTKGIEWLDPEHKTPFYMKFAQAAGFARADETLDYPPFETAQTAALRRDASEQWIFLAPGSGPLEVHKRWPIAAFAALARRLLEHSPHIRIAVFGGAHERMLLTELFSAIGNDARCQIVGLPDIGQSLEILKDAACVVAGCSGSLHLAALAGRPIVGIYGPTNPSVTGPHSNNVHIVRLGLECSPCYRPGFVRGCGNPICMTAIDAERVYGYVLDALDGRVGSLPLDVKTTMAVEPAYPVRAQ